MKITTQPGSETDVAHTFHDTAEQDERTPEATTAEVRFSDLGINVDLIRTLGGVRIGGVFIEIYRGELRVMVWREPRREVRKPEPETYGADQAPPHPQQPRRRRRRCRPRGDCLRRLPRGL